jgi:hypothetical protein
MFLRRSLSAALALAGAVACAPSVDNTSLPTPPGGSGPAVDYAVFDPTATTPAIPVPNDLALQQSAIDAQVGAQKELLTLFATSGGFPNDQETPVTIDFQRQSVAADGTITNTAPDLDVTTFSSSNFVVLAIPVASDGTPTGNPADGGVDAPQASDYVKASDRGTLTLHHTADSTTHSRAWAAGHRYIVAIRGGDNGVHTSSGGTMGNINPMPVTYLITRGIPLNDPSLYALIPGNTTDEKAAAAAQLEQLRQSYLPAFQAIAAAGIPTEDIAVLQTFTIAPAKTGVSVVTDASAGKVPLPSDLLLDPTTNLVANLPQAFCGGVVDSSGSCAAARGLATLDGFSTTAMLLSPLSGLIDPATVTQNTVFLYDISGLTKTPVVAPARVKEVHEGAGAGFVAEPTTIQSCSGSCVSQVIGLQPATIVIAGSTVALPPLKEGTEYAVLITDGVMTPGGSPTALQRSTLSSILLFDSPLADANGKSLLAGQPDATAAGLEKMRQGVAAAIAAQGIDKSHVVLGYTFRTQTMKNTAVQLAAAPYSPQLAPLCQELGISGFDCTKPVPGSTKVYTTSGAGVDGTVASIFDKYGVDSSLSQTGIGTIIETQIATLNGLDPATGAFNPDQTHWVPEVIDVLIAVPSPANSNLQTCSGALAGLSPGKCLPLAIFQHGINGARTQMLLVANTLTAAGLVVAAIDVPKHGSRSYCSQLLGFVNGGGNKNAECVPGNFCVPDPTLANQGDSVPAGIPAGVSATPGKCRTADDPSAPLGTFVNQPTLCINGSCTFPANAGFPLASGQYFVSSNFFRTRDSIRQNLIDQSRLIQVLEPTPAAPPLAGQDVFNTLANQGLFIVPLPDATFVVGQSLGAMIGTVNLAANPRISRAVFNVGGGTLVDVFTSSPAFKDQVDQLFLGLGIDRSQLGSDPAVAAQYLQTLQVAKWILDPAEPLNYAGNITGNTLPNLLPPLEGATDGSVAQNAKTVLAQHAACDQTVPNPFNALLAGDIGLSPLAPPGSPGSGTVQWFVNTAGPAISDPLFGCNAGLRVPHAFLASWGAGLTGQDQTNVQALTVDAQTAAAAFLLTGADQSTLVVH